MNFPPAFPATGGAPENPLKVSYNWLNVLLFFPFFYRLMFIWIFPSLRFLLLPHCLRLFLKDVLMHSIIFKQSALHEKVQDQVCSEENNMSQCSQSDI